MGVCLEKISSPVSIIKHKAGEKVNMEFKGKLAVITGGASGIGRSVALTLARLGTDIVVADLDEARLGNVSQEIESLGVRALALHCDVTRNTDIENLVTQTISGLGTPDFLMNNAGVAVYGKPEKISIANYEYVMGVNVLGVIRGTLAFLPHMLKKGSGHIINTSSRVALQGQNDPYALSKLAVFGYSEGLYYYVRPKGIMVSVLCPAFVNTNLGVNATIVGDEREIQEGKLEQERKFKGPDSMHPDDVAKLVIEAIKEKKFLILTPGTEGNVTNALKTGRDYQKLEKYLQEYYKS
jgi:NAD(P)-dependent dehydrogenase (short-subunit alcohol dehydrogenase family)